MADPWAFGWTQLLAIVGLGMSGVVSIAGLKTFGKWQREKVHERKLEVAFEALTLAYESGMVFDDIRRRLVRPYEWADMPTENMSNEDIQRSQTTYAIINRIGRHGDFFDRVLILQPKLMAVFGPDMEATVAKLHKARNMIELACEMLIEIPDPTTPDERSLILQMRADIFPGSIAPVKEPERVTNLLREFRAEIEAKCGPLVNREFKASK